MGKKHCLLAAGLAVLIIIMLVAPVLAAAPAGSGGYLAGYENAAPKPAGFSWWSTIAYLISLFAVFAFVVVMAYFASRFIGGRFSRTLSGEGGRILAHLPLGPNRSICVAEIAERVFMLGVTEHSITLLREITDADEIERLHRYNIGNIGDDPFAEQFGSFQQLARRIPSLFKDGRYRK